MHQHISAGVDGGLSRVLHVRRHGGEDPIALAEIYYYHKKIYIRLDSWQFAQDFFIDSLTFISYIGGKPVGLVELELQVNKQD